MKPTDRQMYILQMVRTNPDIVVDDLAKSTGVARNTIIRDLVLLRKAGLLTRNLKRRKRSVLIG